jgi:hypothetical protein
MNSATNVVISIPPSHQADGSKDGYLEEVQEALSLLNSHPSDCPCCDEADQHGMCLLISSTGVYGNEHEVKNEFSSVNKDPTNHRAQR